MPPTVKALGKWRLEISFFDSGLFPVSTLSHLLLWFLHVVCHHQSVLQTSHCALTFYFSGSLSLLIPGMSVVWLIQVFNPFLLLLYYFPPSPPSLTFWSRFSLQVTHQTHSLVNRFICFITPLLSVIIANTPTSINPTTYTVLAT